MSSDLLARARRLFFGESRAPWRLPDAQPGTQISAIKEQFSGNSGVSLEDDAFWSAAYGPDYRQLTCWNLPVGPGFALTMVYGYHQPTGAVFRVATGHLLGQVMGRIGQIDLNSSFTDVTAELGEPTRNREFAPAIDEHWWDADEQGHYVACYSKDHGGIHGNFVKGQLDVVAVWSPSLAPDGFTEDIDSAIHD